MRLTLMANMAKSPHPPDPDLPSSPQVNLAASIGKELGRLKWFLWHGNVFRALHVIDELVVVWSRAGSSPVSRLELLWDEQRLADSTCSTAPSAASGKRSSPIRMLPDTSGRCRESGTASERRGLSGPGGAPSHALVGGGGRAPDPWLTDNQDIAEGLSAAGLWVAAVSTDAAAEPVTVEMAISQANNAAPNRIDAPRHALAHPMPPRCRQPGYPGC